MFWSMVVTGITIMTLRTPVVTVTMTFVGVWHKNGSAECDVVSTMVGTTRRVTALFFWQPMAERQVCFDGRLTVFSVSSLCAANRTWYNVDKLAYFVKRSNETDSVAFSVVQPSVLKVQVNAARTLHIALPRRRIRHLARFSDRSTIKMIGEGEQLTDRSPHPT